LLDYIGAIERSTGRKAVMNMLPMQPGDVADTFADVDPLAQDTGYRPTTTVEVGVARFVEWYREYHGV
jgi:UDP-glucuronate 4-epimerase